MFLGKVGSMPANMARKCALKLRIENLAELRRWTLGVTG